jgi:hypothetical protein
MNIKIIFHNLSLEKRTFPPILKAEKVFEHDYGGGIFDEIYHFKDEQENHHLIYVYSGRYVFMEIIISKNASTDEIINELKKYNLRQQNDPLGNIIKAMLNIQELQPYATEIISRSAI